MKFGKDFKTHLEETLPEWRDKFLSYKPLKKLIKHIDDDDDAAAWIGPEDWFVRILNEELDKFNDFYVDKEEDFVIRLQMVSFTEAECSNYKATVFAQEKKIWRNVASWSRNANFYEDPLSLHLRRGREPAVVLPEALRKLE